MRTKLTMLFQSNLFFTKGTNPLGLSAACTMGISSTAIFSAREIMMRSETDRRAGGKDRLLPNSSQVVIVLVLSPHQGRRR